jgi:hypothetical protein
MLAMSKFLRMEASMRNAHALSRKLGGIHAHINLRIFGGIQAYVLLRKRGVAAPLSRVAEPGTDPHYI